MHATDAPDDIGDFSSLTIQVARINLKGGGAGGANSSYAPATSSFDLTKLTNGNLTTLFKDQVPAGNYTYLEIEVSSATGVLKAGGKSVDVKAPSNRIFLNTHFEVKAGQETDFLFDIQVHMVGNGDYQLKPNAGGSHVR
ncbi:MAG: DUF4382 domain-containing protein [Halobacteriales archaeon]|nr:DUF4382 domain-containing protein [Halobacteriales archaeon]